MAPLLKFTVLRFALFVAALVVLALLGARGWLLLLLAAFVSLLLSYVLLRGPREELTASIAARAGQRNGAGRRQGHRLKADVDAEVEDAEIERAEKRDPPE